MMSARNAVAGMAGLTLILVGVSFLGLGVTSALEPVLGLAGAAAVTGVLLLLPPILWAAAKRSSPVATDARRPMTGYEDLWIAELSRLAHKKPLLAVLAAFAVGAASSLLRKD
jgi:hypothetical protein